MLYVPQSLRKTERRRKYMYTNGHEYDYYDMIGVEVGAFVIYDDQRIVLVYGYGKLDGYAVPVGAINEDSLDMVDTGQRCPRIKLDDGGVIWGSEAYWLERGLFDSLMRKYAGAGYRLLPVDIGEHRRLVAQRQLA